MKKRFFRSFWRTTKLIALQPVHWAKYQTTEEKIVLGKNYWHFLLSLKALVAYHTRIICFIETPNWPFQTTADILKILARCARVHYSWSMQAYLAHAQQISQLLSILVIDNIKMHYFMSFCSPLHAPLPCICIYMYTVIYIYKIHII